MTYIDQLAMFNSAAYVAVCKTIRPLVPFGWLNSLEADAIRLAADSPEAAIDALLERAKQIKAGL